MAPSSWFLRIMARAMNSGQAELVKGHRASMAVTLKLTAVFFSFKLSRYETMSVTGECGTSEDHVTHEKHSTMEKLLLLQQSARGVLQTFATVLRVLGVFDERTESERVTFLDHVAANLDESVAKGRTATPNLGM